MFKKTFLLVGLFTFLFASESLISSNEDLTLIGNKAASEYPITFDPPIDLPDSMWIMIDSVLAQTTYQGIHVEGDTIYCTLQASAVHKRDRKYGTLFSSFATSSGTNISVVRFGDSICISKLTSPERCEVYTLDGTFVRQFQPSGGQQVRGLEWDGDKFWATTYSDGLHIYTMTRTGTVLKDLVQSGGVTTPTIGRDIALDQMYPNRLWTIPNTTVPGSVIYIAFDTIANTYTPLVQYFSTGHGYHSGIAFYTDLDIGGCVYTSSFSGTYIWWYKVHEPIAPIFSVLPTNIDFGTQFECFPNPFTNTTVIRFTLDPNLITSKLSIYDVRGRLIKILTLPSQVSEIIWDGTNHAGKQVPKGLYFVTLTDNKNRVINNRKIVRTK